MAMKRDWRRVGAASATVAAGARVLFAAGTGPASADTRSAVSSLDECKLGKLLCGLLGAGAGTSSSPPKAPVGGTSTNLVVFFLPLSLLRPAAMLALVL